MEATSLTFEASASSGAVEALSLRPAAAWAVLVFGHGAGAGMRHPFMTVMSERLASRGIATLRYEFPYMASGSRRPDPAAVLMKTVVNAVTVARDLYDGLPLFAGGKSMGGRMTSNACAAAAGSLPGVRGLVFFGFPLHPAGRPSSGRGDHLSVVRVPMLFLQGTRDALADLELLRPLCAALAPRASLHVVEGADHGFHVLKRSGRTDAGVFDELADTARSWMEGLAP